MNAELVVSFEKQFIRGAKIRGELRIPADEFSVTVLFGSSGCGKTTILRCLAGLERPDSGQILFKGEPWFDSESRIHRSPQERKIGFLFQDYALFPHLTVAQNIAYGLKSMNAAVKQRLISDIVDRFHLHGLELRLPHQISGGQQQRVALARALVRRPGLLLLDEPLSALDAGLREELRCELKQMLSEFGIPVILVTHDFREAAALADRIVVMHAGRMIQQGTTGEVYSRPRDSNVAKIMGFETIVPGAIIGVENGIAMVRIGDVQIKAAATVRSSSKVTACLRAEDVSIDAAANNLHTTAVMNQLPALITHVVPDGRMVRITAECGFRLTALTSRASHASREFHIGDQAIVSFNAAAVQLTIYEE